MLTNKLFFQKDGAEFFLQPLLMKHQDPQLIFAQHPQPLRGLSKMLQGNCIAQNAERILRAQHPQELPQFSQTWASGLLPDENPGDGPPIGQTGIVEEMAKEQAPGRQRPVIKIFDTGKSMITGGLMSKRG